MSDIISFIKLDKSRCISLLLCFWHINCLILMVIYPLNPQLHSRSATYKRNGLLIRKTAIKSSRPFQCAYYPLTP